MNRLENEKQFIDFELKRLVPSKYGYQIHIVDGNGNKTYYMALNKILIERIKKILM